MSNPNFLIEILLKDVYLTQPYGFVNSYELGIRYARFNDPYDGLKKASQNWTIRFDEVINCYNIVGTNENFVYT